LALLLDKVPDDSCATWEDANLLAQFRNRFMHFTPAWDHEKNIHEGDFVKEMRERVPTSRFYQSSFMFPYGFMTYGCAKWSIETARKFSAGYAALIDHPAKLTESSALP
jgi:hypothetical protein